MDFFSLFLILVGFSTIFYCYTQKIPASLSLVMSNFIIFFFWWIAVLLFDYDGHITWRELGFNPLLTLKYSTLFSLELFNLNILTLVSSMFIHSGPLHLLMNMLILILMGLPFEERVGGRAFVKIYLTSGLLGSLLTGLSAIHLGTGEADSYHIGASGAVFGIMGAFAYLYPRDEIPMLLGFIFLHRVPVFIAAVVFAGAETAFVVASSTDNIGHDTHLISLVIGALFAPYFLSSITSTPLATLDHLDKLASTVNLQKILKKAKNADESDVREAWIQKFHEEIKETKDD
tara:strand:+ start:815 stop:1681 length:867 start_codon:yes stop_codon:yes gene_type:complete